MTNFFSRRLFLSFSAAFGLAMPALALARIDDAPRDAAPRFLPDDSIGGWFGALYAVLPDRAPVHLADFEAAYDRAIFKARANGARLERFTNPLTGVTHAVEAAPLRRTQADERRGALPTSTRFDPFTASHEIMFAPTAITPYMPWLGMGSLPGFALWHCQGRIATAASV